MSVKNHKMHFDKQFTKRRTFQPPPPAYDNHAFRPGAAPQAPNNGPKQITASSVYQGMVLNFSFFIFFVIVIVHPIFFKI